VADRAAAARRAASARDVSARNLGAGWRGGDDPEPRRLALSHGRAASRARAV